MPLINPLANNNEATNKIVDTYVIPQTEYDRINTYLNCSTWQCSSCNTVVMGRCLKCPYCYGKLGVITLKPEE